MKKKLNVLALIISVIIAEGAGMIGSIFTSPYIQTWYSTLVKPGFNPPNWLFAPVWTLLFLFMGISSYLIWQKKQRGLIAFYLIHLGVNILWSIMFFALHQIGLAVMVIIALWAMILIMILKFHKFNKWASYLLIPYILWVSFATVLNVSLWLLN